MPLLDVYGSCTGGKEVSTASQRPDILFEDFENGYDKWTVEGPPLRFPAQGTLPNQQPVSGFVGKRLVTFSARGQQQGRLVSQAFTDRAGRFIRLKLAEDIPRIRRSGY